MLQCAHAFLILRNIVINIVIKYEWHIVKYQTIWVIHNSYRELPNITLYKSSKLYLLELQ